MLVGFLLVGFAGLGLAGESPSASSVKARWSIRDLGTLGGRSSGVSAINESGQIVGSCETKQKDRDGLPVSHACLWSSGGLRDLGTLGGFQSYADAINQRGEVIGTSDTNKRGWPHHAFVWKNGLMRDLGTLGGSNSAATAINDTGQIVGRSFVVGDSLDAFVWVKGRMRDLGKDTDARDINEHGQVVRTNGQAFIWQNGKLRGLGGSAGAASDARKINNRGQVAGIATASDGTDRAFLWKSGKFVELPIARGSGGVFPGCVVWAINQGGTVVGSCSAAVGSEQPQRDREAWSRAVRWTNDAAATDLGTLGGRYSEAVAINSRGQIVGWSYTKERNQHAFFWENGKLTDLGTLPGDRSSAATALNNHNQIVGVSTSKSGQQHAVLWTPKTGS